MKTNPIPSLQRLLAIYSEIETDRLHKLGYTNLRVIARVKEDENYRDKRMERMHCPSSVH